MSAAHLASLLRDDARIKKNVHETTAYLRVGASLLSILLCVMLKYHARRSGLGASISRSPSLGGRHGEAAGPEISLQKGPR